MPRAVWNRRAVLSRIPGQRPPHPSGHERPAADYRWRRHQLHGQKLCISSLYSVSWASLAGLLRVGLTSISAGGCSSISIPSNCSNSPEKLVTTPLTDLRTRRRALPLRVPSPARVNASTPESAQQGPQDRRRSGRGPSSGSATTAESGRARRHGRQRARVRPIAARRPRARRAKARAAGPRGPLPSAGPPGPRPPRPPAGPAARRPVRPPPPPVPPLRFAPGRGPSAAPPEVRLRRRVRDLCHDCGPRSNLAMDGNAMHSPRRGGYDSPG